MSICQTDGFRIGRQANHVLIFGQGLFSLAPLVKYLSLLQQRPGYDFLVRRVYLFDLVERFQGSVQVAGRGFRPPELQEGIFRP